MVECEEGDEVRRRGQHHPPQRVRVLPQASPAAGDPPHPVAGRVGAGGQHGRRRPTPAAQVKVLVGRETLLHDCRYAWKGGKLFLLSEGLWVTFNPRPTPTCGHLRKHFFPLFFQETVRPLSGHEEGLWRSCCACIFFSPLVVSVSR